MAGAAERLRRRKLTNLWHWLIALALALAAAVAAGTLVFIAWQDATSANVRADARRAGTAAVAERDLRRALLLAVAANRLDPADTDALRKILLRSPDLMARSGVDVTAIAVSPDGTSVASGTADGAVWLRRTGTLGTIATLTYAGHAPVEGLAFTPDGRRLVSWAGTAAEPAPASVVVWDLGSRQPDGAAFGRAWPDAGGGLLADGSTLILTQHAADQPVSAIVAWSLDSRTPSTAYDLPTAASGPVPGVRQRPHDRRDHHRRNVGG